MALRNPARYFTMYPRYEHEDTQATISRREKGGDTADSSKNTNS